MGKLPKLDVREIADVPLREVSGLALRGSELLAVGDHDPVVFTAPLEPWPLRWQGIDLAGLGLPDGGTQFEAIQPVGEHTILVLQEQPARVLFIDLAAPAALKPMIGEAVERRLEALARALNRKPRLRVGSR